MALSKGSFYMLDTNTVSFLANGRSKAARQTFDYHNVDRRTVLSAVTEAELRFGMVYRPLAVRTLAALQDLRERIAVALWDSAAAVVYGNLRAKLAAAGQSVGALDLLIAAHASSLGAVLVTHDHALLRLAPYLDVMDWATDL